MLGGWSALGELACAEETLLGGSVPTEGSVLGRSLCTGGLCWKDGLCYRALSVLGT